MYRGQYVAHLSAGQYCQGAGRLKRPVKPRFDPPALPRLASGTHGAEAGRDASPFTGHGFGSAGFAGPVLSADNLVTRSALC
jgi:hypothetical protein